MTHRRGGFRAKTRRTFKKKPRMRGKVSTTRLLQSFETGEKVMIDQEPAIQKAMPHPRFKGKTGTITGKQGKAYKVKIYDGNKEKLVLSAPIHLKRH